MHAAHGWRSCSAKADFRFNACFWHNAINLNCVCDGLGGCICLVCYLSMRIWAAPLCLDGKGGCGIIVTIASSWNLSLGITNSLPIATNYADDVRDERTLLRHTSLPC